MEVIEVTPLDKLREQIKIARATPNSLGQAFVVLTADEAQAVVDQVSRSGFSILDCSKLPPYQCLARKFADAEYQPASRVSEPPGAHDDAVES